jgi:hypothetical protein
MRGYEGVAGGDKETELRGGWIAPSRWMVRLGSGRVNLERQKGINFLMNEHKTVPFSLIKKRVIAG